MYEGMTGYAESATAGLNGGYSGRINPDYGGDTGKIRFQRDSKFKKIVRAVLEVERQKLRGEFGADEEIADEKAVEEIVKIFETMLA